MGWQFGERYSGKVLSLYSQKISDIKAFRPNLETSLNNFIIINHPAVYPWTSSGFVMMLMADICGCLLQGLVLDDAGQSRRFPRTISASHYLNEALLSPRQNCSTSGNPTSSSLSSTIRCSLASHSASFRQISAAVLKSRPHIVMSVNHYDCWLVLDLSVTF